MVSYDIDPAKDDFILLSTDGIFQSMSVSEVVKLASPRLTLSRTNTASLRLKKALTRSSAAS